MQAETTTTMAAPGREEILAQAPSGGAIAAAAMVSDRLCIALASPPLEPLSRGEGWIVAAARAQRVRVALLGAAEQSPSLLLLLEAGAGHEPLGLDGQLVLDTPDGLLGLEPDCLEEALVPLERLLAEHLPQLAPEVRERALEQIVEIAGRDPERVPASAEAMLAIREALRPRLPAAELAPGAELAMNVEGLWRIDDHAFYVEGWILDRSSALARVRILTPAGRAIEILDRAYRFPRPDVAEFFGMPARERLGFITYVETPEPCPSASPWILQAQAPDGSGIEVAMPQAVDGAHQLRTIILHDLELERLPEERLRARHIRPALARLEAALGAGIEIDSVEQLGSPSAAPAVSVIVPLYRRLEFLEQQMAQFVHDPELHESDLVYVLDSPEDADAARHMAGELFRLYGVPFRLAVLSANGGFSVANNLGASLARGRMLLLLNSDVLPAAPGWIGRMTAFYDGTPSIGALAPKLLYEDDSIQHAGLYFDRPPGAHLWSNEHHFKGLHRGFPAANVARRVAAVTGACLMISRELYDAVGGLRGTYIRGDYEDSDLCLRLREIGRASWYLPEVELYHLEGQSYPSEERRLTSEFNRWLHTAIWREVIPAATATGEPGR